MLGMQVGDQTASYWFIAYYAVREDVGITT
jgi:hypothetical protein